MQIDKPIELDVFSLSQTCLTTGILLLPQKALYHTRGAQILQSSPWDMQFQATSLPPLLIQQLLAQQSRKRFNFSFKP